MSPTATAPVAALYDVEAPYMGGTELIEFEAVVGAKNDQVATAPGALKRKWTEAEDVYFSAMAVTIGRPASRRGSVSRFCLSGKAFHQ